MTQAVPLPHLAFSGANPSPPGQPQKQTPVDDPHAEVEIKPQLKPRGIVAKEEELKSSYHCTNCRLSPHNQLGRLLLWNISKDIDNFYKRTYPSSDSCKHWRQEHKGAGLD